MSFFWIRSLVVIAIALSWTSIRAQDSASIDFATITMADTTSPRATLKSFLDGANEFYDRIQEDRFYDRNSDTQRRIAVRILDCLDGSKLAEFERLEAMGEAAICLKEILDRVELPLESEIPGSEAIEDESGPSMYRIPGTRITISRVEEGPQRHEYLFSPGSVERAIRYYRDVESLPYVTNRKISPGFYEWYMTAPGNPSVAMLVDRLPDWFRVRSMGMARWMWLGLLVTLFIALTLMTILYRSYLKWGIRWSGGPLVRYCLLILLPIAAMLVPVGFKWFVHNILTLRGNGLYLISFLSNLVVILASVVVVFGAINRIAAVIIASPRINPQSLDAQFIRIVSKLLSIILSVIILIEGGRYLGIPVTTLLASAGVGGLAVALAAQDTLKNLFGTIMLLADKPFRVGERIVFGKYDGVVEEIGLRSTRIRLLSGHQATVPNDVLAGKDIENVGRRPYIKRTAVLELPSGTPAEKVRKALEIVRAALKDHEGMKDALPPRVSLRDLNDSSIGICMIYWYHPPNYWDYLAFTEKVNLEIMEGLEAEGIPFAAPALTVHSTK